MTIVSRSVESWSIFNKNINPKKIIGSTFTTAAILSSNFLLPHNVDAFGPVSLPLKVVSYKPVELCNGRKPIMPGQKAAFGLFPVCIEVEADILESEKSSKTLTDVSVYGFVKEVDAGNSVLPNNPDFNTDAGQYAIIQKINPGDTHLTYQFVAAVAQVNPLPKLTFEYTKAVAFPGGEKFKPLSECEIDPRADGCDAEEE